LSDPVSLARDARQSLAQVQNSLQSAADVPAGALEATIALAQAIAALVPIERSLGAVILPHAASARERARGALTALEPHAASATVRAAASALTTTLAQLDSLSTMQPVAPAAPPPSTVVPAAVPARPPQQAPRVGPTGTVAQAPSAAAFVHASSGPASSSTGTVQVSDAVRVEVVVDASSASQFYCRLWGNDVVAQGGLFIATPAPHPVGAPVTVHVRLPEGAFEATGVVRWTRHPGDPDGPPGFGVSFVVITEDAHRRVNAFARARSPLTYPRE
jgi:uncharacterized protein (TIGR02266 family)